MGFEVGSNVPSPQKSQAESVKGKEKIQHREFETVESWKGRLYKKINKTLEGKDSFAKRLQKIANLENVFNLKDMKFLFQHGVDLLVKQTNPNKYRVYFYDSGSKVHHADIEIRKDKVFIENQEVSPESCTNFVNEMHKTAHFIRTREATEQIIHSYEGIGSALKEDIRPLFGAVFAYNTGEYVESTSREREMPENYRKTAGVLAKRIKSTVNHQLLPKLRPEEQKNMLFHTIASQLTKHPLFEKISGIKWDETKQRFIKTGPGSAFYENLLYLLVVKAINEAVDGDPYWSDVIMQAHMPSHEDLTRTGKGPFTEWLGAL